MSDPTYPLFPVFSFVASILALVPLPWHLQAWNAGTCIYMIWASLASLVYFVDSIIWHSSLDNLAPVWCDISTKFIVGAGVGIPASTLCINRRLYSIASVQAVSITRKDKLRTVMIDCAIAIGLPVLVMVLHYIVQGHRFNILEGVGCLPTTLNTPAAYPLVYMWPILLGCISFVYAALTLRAFLIRRAQFNELLASGSSSLTVSRYFRLMLLSCMEMACTLPLAIFSVYINNHGVEMVKWVSWADTHFNFSFVQMVPALVWQHNYAFRVSVEMSRWIFPACALTFFLLFGFADEARRNYRSAFNCVVGLFKIRRTVQNKGKQFLSEGKTPVEDILPAYSPRYGHHKAALSVTSSTFSNLSETDLEKGHHDYTFQSPTLPRIGSTSTFAIPSPTSPNCFSDSETLAYQESETDSRRIQISEAFPPSRPPTPPLPVTIPVPHVREPTPTQPDSPRPFSPPSVVPANIGEPSPVDGSLFVVIHTESHRTFDN